MHPQSSPMVVIPNGGSAPVNRYIQLSIVYMKALEATGGGWGGRQVYDHAKFKIFLGKDPWIHRFEGLGRPWGHDREGHGHGREEA